MTEHLESPLLGEHLRGCDAVVHVVAPTDLPVDQAEDAARRRDRLVTEVRTLMLACAAVGASRLVVVTGAQVYGARADNPLPLPEDAPLRAEPDAGTVGDLLAVEQAIFSARASYPALEVTVVRPAMLVGGVDTVLTRHFEAPRLLRIGGCEPAWQFCHVEDLASAVGRVLDEQLGPVVTVGAEGWLSQAELERASGMRSVELGTTAARAIASRLHRIGVLKSPVGDLDYVAHPWVIGSETLRAAGWAPAYDNETCVAVLLADVRLRRGDGVHRFDTREGAALGAASAAVAVGATAAIMRRRRRRSGG